MEALNGTQGYLATRRKTFEERRNLVVHQLRQARGLACRMPEGAFYAFPTCAGTLGKKTPSGQILHTDQDAAARLLEAEGVAVVHGRRAQVGVPPGRRAARW